MAVAVLQKQLHRPSPTREDPVLSLIAKDSGNRGAIKML